MPEKNNYLKVLIELADKASKTYMKYQEYQSSPEKFKEYDPGMYTIFKAMHGMIGLINNRNIGNDSSYSNSDKKTDNSSVNIREMHYKALDCKFSDNNETIKVNYKKMVKKFHPDSISGKDLPEEFIEFANQKFIQVQTAYEYIKQERNF